MIKDNSNHCSQTEKLLVVLGIRFSGQKPKLKIQRLFACPVGMLLAKKDKEDLYLVKQDNQRDSHVKSTS